MASTPVVELSFAGSYGAMMSPDFRGLALLPDWHRHARWGTGRVLMRLGHEVRLMPASYVTAVTEK